MKFIYVRIIRVIRIILKYVGFLHVMQSNAKNSSFWRWVRSLFAIYDIEDMIALDIPWWNVKATDHVASFLNQRSHPVVFEFGSGASTFWLARRAHSVTSVEHDRKWFARVKERLQSVKNVTLIHVPQDEKLSENACTHSHKDGYRGQSFETYINAILDTKILYDLVIVDGRARAGCFEAAEKMLKPDGMIVFDNDRRKRYNQVLSNTALSRKKYFGLTYCLPYFDGTSLFLNKNF